MNFKAARSLAKDLAKETLGKSNGTIANTKLVSASVELSEMVEARAAALNSPLVVGKKLPDGTFGPGIKAKQHKILEADAAIKKLLTPAKMQNAFLSKPSDGVRKDFINGVRQADEALGTRMADAMEKDQFQSIAEDMFADPTAFDGSWSSALRAVISGASKSGREAFSASGAVTSIARAAAGFGGLKAGRVARAFKDPETLVKGLVKNKAGIQRAAQDPLVRALGAGRSSRIGGLAEPLLAPWRQPVGGAVEATGRGMLEPANPASAAISAFTGPEAPEGESSLGPETNAPGVPQLSPALRDRFKDINLEEDETTAP